MYLYSLLIINFYYQPHLRYKFIKEIRLILIKEKVNKNRKTYLNEDSKVRLQKKVEKIGNANLKKNLNHLINIFSKKK